ncbi:radical SAM/SPASM protein FxsBH, inactivated beta-hydroxylase extension form [Streptomyces sp. H39-S7]|uniref:radical SAM/SPASM protein FxsBH, inactivated beta-hydroxylase extension form n=1 Tax=Streptomyces sp. H39-S7 TaxID=3004357 RepID=UPI0022B013C6|nr:radical SAM/SPASM protein FxsB, inactivated metallohydrolase extension form [Streptomyces sp. H39-S7]MCZ4122282.1 radical SAM/SPASM protein FxsB, inactivated metallohydrolase extension form [Streptomyces sp. H39-S7]
MTVFPLRQLVLKVHGRCNLACDHCYVYEHADQSWRTRPNVISDQTVAQTARRFADYAREEKLDSVSVILHGGEPLLVGPAGLRSICEELTRTIAPVTALDLRIHTNGVTLNRRHLEVFAEFDVKVGISLDGDRAANDRHRLDRKGRSSYDRVVQAVDLLRSPEFRHLYLGLLCTVDVANDPVLVHDALAALDPPRIDYLLPHSTWDHPPSRPTGSPTAYADWLLRVFDRWDERGRTVPVRTFDSVLSTLGGGPSETEALGLAPSDLAVVETDGSFEQADSLKTAYDGAAATGYDVYQHSFGELVRHPGVRARQLGISGVSETCRKCPVVESCGGGLYAHRYRDGSGFDNPSVFCGDLLALIDGIADRNIQRDLSPAVRSAERLRADQLQLNRELLALLHNRQSGRPGWDEVWRTLLQQDADDSVLPHLDAVLGHPYARTFLRRSLDGPADTGRLAVTVAAVALRAAALGVVPGETAMRWDADSAVLHLPTLGTLQLTGPGPVEITATSGRLLLREATGAEHRLPIAGAAGDLGSWRPLYALGWPEGAGTGDAPLLDDANPYRDCFAAPVTPGLDPGAVADFRVRWGEAAALLADRVPGWSKEPAALFPTVVTPLAVGAGVRTGAHGPGAIGVAVDAPPEAIARGVLREGRLAWLAALRESTDLHLPGTGAGPLLDAASTALGEADYWSTEPAEDPRRRAALARADEALVRFDARPERELTASGAAVAAQLRSEWRELRG